MWDPILAKAIEPLEMLQHRAARFIARLRGPESVTETFSELGLQPLKQRCRNHRLLLLSLLMKILQDKERNLTLSLAYDKIAGDCQKVTDN